jgi:hypothetical protein
MSNPDFANGGVYQKIRENYFRERTPEREYELRELVRDVEYLVHELERVERRARVPSLVASNLRYLYIQLRFWEDRPRYKTDADMYRVLAYEFDTTSNNIRKIVFDGIMKDAWWAKINVAGQEIESVAEFERYRNEKMEQMGVLRRQSLLTHDKRKGWMKDEI